MITGGLWLPLELAAGTDLASPDLLSETMRQHLQTPAEDPATTARRARSARWANGPLMARPPRLDLDR